MTESPDISFKAPKKPVATQASRLFEKFGGQARLAEALINHGKIKSRITVYKWGYPKERGGTNGLVPTAQWPNIMYVARLEGVHLPSTFFDPREM